MGIQQQHEPDLASARVDCGQAAAATAGVTVVPSRGAQAVMDHRVPLDASGIAATALGFFGVLSVTSFVIMDLQ